MDGGCPILLAEPGVDGLGMDGDGDGAGDADSSNTVITSFCPWLAQWLLTPQMYHFLPVVDSVITSFPLERPSFGGGTVQFAKAVPLTLNTLCRPAVYLKTEYIYIYI